MIKACFKAITPSFLKVFLRDFQNRIRENEYKREIIQFYYKDRKWLTADQGIRDAVNFLLANKLSFIPYDFTRKYCPNQIIVECDPDSGLYYVMHLGHRLYFKRGMERVDVQGLYNSLLIEAEQDSPHKYVSDDFDLPKGAVLADVGAAEGIFTLANIDKVEKAYLFEMDDQWLEALRLTFHPWKDKIVIIPKAVGEIDSENQVKLDTYFEDKKVDFLKADIEGYEKKMLLGARKLLSNCSPLVSICTYHRDSDYEDIESFLLEEGYITHPSKNYILWIFQRLDPPYFRRGIIRGFRKC